MRGGIAIQRKHQVKTLGMHWWEIAESRLSFCADI